MSELFSFGDHAPYVWAAYGITLAVVVWNIWSARALLKRNLREAVLDGGDEEAPRQAKVSQL